MLEVSPDYITAIAIGFTDVAVVHPIPVQQSYHTKVVSKDLLSDRNGLFFGRRFVLGLGGTKMAVSRGTSTNDSGYLSSTIEIVQPTFIRIPQRR